MHSGKPDDIDRKILHYLQADARMNLGKLAGMVNLTIGPLTTRLEKLEAEGLVKKYMAVLDREKVGLPVLVILMVRLRQQNTQLLDEFEALVSAMPEVLSCRNVSGSWNFIVEVSAQTPQAYAVWLLEKVNVDPNVSMVESAFLLKEGKDYGAYPLRP